MDAMRWRFRSKIVAYVDLTISILGIGIIAFLLYTCIHVTITFEKNGDDSGVLWFAVVLLWAGVLVGIIVDIFSVIAAWRLLVATDKTTDLQIALKSCQFWRTFNVVLLIISCIDSAITFAIMSLVFSLIVQGTCIYVVSQFITELRNAVTLPSNSHSNVFISAQNPDEIITITTIN